MDSPCRTGVIHSLDIASGWSRLWARGLDSAIAYTVVCLAFCFPFDGLPGSRFEGHAMLRACLWAAAIGSPVLIARGCRLRCLRRLRSGATQFVLLAAATAILVVSGATWLSDALLSGLAWDSPYRFDSYSASMSALIASVALRAYEATATSITGQTLGKLWQGIRVVSVDSGETPSWRQSLVRAFTPYFARSRSCYLPMLRDLNAGHHDTAARTIVVYRNYLDDMRRLLKMEHSR